MKKLLLILLAATLVNIGFWLGSARTAHAQTSSNGTFYLLNVGAPSACAWSASATFTNAMAICATTSGLYYAVNGSSTFNPVSAAAGVTSFNGRTGAVTPAAGDYSYSQLSAPPTSVTSGNFAVTSATIK